MVPLPTPAATATSAIRVLAKPSRANTSVAALIKSRRLASLSPILGIPFLLFCGGQCAAQAIIGLQAGQQKTRQEIYARDEMSEAELRLHTIATVRRRQRIIAERRATEPLAHIFQNVFFLEQIGDEASQREVAVFGAQAQIDQRDGLALIR